MTPLPSCGLTTKGQQQPTANSSRLTAHSHSFTLTLAVSVSDSQAARDNTVAATSRVTAKRGGGDRAMSKRRGNICTGSPTSAAGLRRWDLHSSSQARCMQHSYACMFWAWRAVITSYIYLGMRWPRICLVLVGGGLARGWGHLASCCCCSGCAGVRVQPSLGCMCSHDHMTGCMTACLVSLQTMLLSCHMLDCFHTGCPTVCGRTPVLLHTMLVLSCPK